MDWFGFYKDPWIDVPLNPQLEKKHNEIFVKTKKIKPILEELDKILNTKQGALWLVIGPRGIGKTKLLNIITYQANSHPNAFAEKIEPPIYSVKKNPYYLATYIFEKIYQKLIEPKEINLKNDYSPENLKKVIEYYVHDEVTQFPVFCIDELDKLNTKEDMNFIRRFFVENQNYFQQLEYKSLIIISCSPDWVFLNSKDLSYLNYVNRIELGMLDLEEAKELVSKRLSVVSKKIEDVFVPDTIPHLLKISGGNPRILIQKCKKLCIEAFENQKKRIDIELIENIYEEDIKKNITLYIEKIAESSEFFNKALKRIWRFYQELEIRNEDPIEGLKIFKKFLYESEDKKGRIEKRKIPGKLDVLLARARCASTVPDYNGKTHIEWFELDKPVLEFFKELERYGITIDDFAESYVAKPVYPKLSDIDVLINEKQNYFLEKSKKASDIFSAAVQIYKNLKNDYQRMSNQDIILNSWKAIEFFMKAELVLEGLPPMCPKCRYKLPRGIGVICPKCKTEIDLKEKKGGILKNFKSKVLEERRIFLDFYDDIQYLKKQRNKVAHDYRLHKPYRKLQILKRKEIIERCRKISIEAFEEMLEKL